MFTTISNTTLLFLCVSIVVCLVRYWRCGEKGASVWTRDVIGRVASSKLVIGLLVLGGVVGALSHILVGYLGPGDIFQDFVGAKEFLAGRSMNPTADMRARVAYWLDREPWQPSDLARWPALERFRASSIDNGARQIEVQAHPPFHVLLVTPLVTLCGSAENTFVAMTLVNMVCYGLLLLLVWRSTGLAGVVPAGASTILVLLALDWQPFVANLRQGQIGIVVALLITAGWYLLSRDRSWSAGVLIGAAALIKMFPALLLFWLALRNRRAFAAACATGLIGFGVVYLARGPGAFVDYVHAAAAVERYFGRARINYSLSSVVSYVAAGGQAESVWASVAAYSALGLLFGYSVLLTLRNRRPSEAAKALEFSSYIVLSSLLSPTAEAFYYPMFLLPIALVAARASTLRSKIALLAILLCLSFPDQVVWGSTQLLVHVIGNRSSWLLCSYPTFAMLALWYWTRRPRANLHPTVLEEVSH